MKREAWAEMLREAAFQRLFALRRNLELSLEDESDNTVEARQRRLRSLEGLFVDLSKLRQSLHPAFVEDSLPLALRQKIISWEQRLPSVQFKLTVLTIGLSNSAYDNWFILDILEEWLQLLEGQLKHDCAIAFSLGIDLPEQQLLMTLSGKHLVRTVHIHDPLFQRLTTLFALLLQGQCNVQIQDEQIGWCFRWQPRLNSAFHDPL
jgi:hypothetical protein